MTIAAHTVFFTVPGKPVPKGRPRFTSYNGHYQTYTPKRTQAYEEKIGYAWIGNGPRPPQFTGSVSVYIEVYEGPGHPADLDNYIKVALDALNGLAWADDRQVTGIEACIFRGHEEPHMYVKIEAIE